MKEPIISDLKDVTQDMIDDLGEWIADVKGGYRIAGVACCFVDDKCVCHKLFDNLRDVGKVVWPEYNK